MNRNLRLLAVLQGLLLTNNVVFIAINGLVGLASRETQDHRSGHLNRLQASAQDFF